ncbi:hypothetical protein [Cryptosporangium phraense]|uniref:Uncharacterized protein n=1 Tax=Cryptosporangium phraense TaxID=2593070 RepID=A0A545ARE1_9ACTN|nr:hypothetical protein [Cryptosporangium phraense]TQS43265.1 hypothetical protein FL583_20710 [Cryptosporangium phraense]
MILYVTMVALAVAVATTVSSGPRKRGTTVIAIVGAALWSAAAAGLAIVGGVPVVLVALVGASLGYAVHRLTRRALETRAESADHALILFGRRRDAHRSMPVRPAGASDITLTLNTIRTLDRAESERRPLHWSVVAAIGTTATTLEGYWAYQHLIAGGGVFSDLGALAGFTVLATLTVALTGVAGLAVHMRSTPRLDPAPQAMPAPSDIETIAFTAMPTPKARRSLASRLPGVPTRP